MALVDPIPRDPWTKLRYLALGQEGLFHRMQAAALGVSSSALSRANRAGRIERVLPGVFLLTGVPWRWHAKVRAAVLWAGEGAAASHGTAAACHRMDGFNLGVVEVTVPKRRKSPVVWLTTHRGELTEADVASIDGLHVTTPTRTLVDLGAVADEESIELALEDCLRRGLTTMPRLKWQLQREARPGRNGAGVLKILLAKRGDTRPTESGLETRFARWLRHSRLPQPVHQHPVFAAGRFIARIDFAYPDRKLAIEVDGFRFHSGRNQWYRDRSRLQSLRDVGWNVVLVTKDDLVDHPHRLEQQLAAELGITLF